MRTPWLKIVAAPSLGWVELPCKAMALIGHQSCLFQERLQKDPECSAWRQPSPPGSNLSHMLSGDRIPHQIVQVTPHIKENVENTQIQKPCH